MTKKKKEEEEIQKELKEFKKEMNESFKLGCCSILLIVISILIVLIGIFKESIKIPTEYIPNNLDLTPWILKSKVGNELKLKGYQNKHPIIGIPGYITTALEVWNGKECVGNNFREKMWGGTKMLSNIISDRECWLEHMKLNDKGLDPENIKLRSLNGLESVDYLFPGYFVWARMILELGTIGYDSNNLIIMSYDWRLGLEELEKRDGYFTRLKLNIEYQRKFHNEKVVIISHSLGSLIWYYFMNWIQVNGNDKWIDNNIQHFINIAGPLLGVAKAGSAIISGEMKDTSSFLMQNFLEKLMTIEKRTDLFRSWGSIYTMLPKGGDLFWNQLFLFNNSIHSKNITGNNLTSFLLKNGDKRVKYHLDKHDLGIESKKIKNSSKYWSNPLMSKLPNAPNLKIYCLYGYPKETEIGYFYKKNLEKYQMDTSINIENSTTFGVIESKDGDGTVPLLSLGYMCVNGWKKKLYNPSNIKIITKEYIHNPGSLFEENSIHFRGNGKSSDHVDVMGNFNMLEDILSIASGNHDKVKENIISNIKILSDELDKKIKNL